MFEENLMGQLVTDWRDRSLALLWLFLVARLKIWDLNPTAGLLRLERPMLVVHSRLTKNTLEDKFRNEVTLLKRDYHCLAFLGKQNFVMLKLRISFKTKGASR